MKKLFSISLVILSLVCCNGKATTPNPPPLPPVEEPQPFKTAMEINKALGKGVNLGNTFEASNMSNDQLDVEQLALYIDEIKRIGFKHVRIPVRWDRADRSMSSAPYTINEAFLKKVTTLVDYALRKKLYVIINMHHYSPLMDNPTGERARFLSQWAQLSTHFKDYPETLLFEILNEPRDNMTPTRWNQYLRDALNVIRTTPENSKNKERTVLIGCAEHGGVNALRLIDIPENDKYIIMTPHYYVPYRFTHQNSWVAGSEAWAGMTWDDTDFERNVAFNDFYYAIYLNKVKNIPINVGEFGAYIKADLDSRTRYSNFLSKWFDKQGFSSTYWNFYSDFAIYNTASNTFIQPLTDVLVNNNELEPAITPSVSITKYESAITAGNYDSWRTFKNSATSAYTSSFNNDNSVTINITNSGTDVWTIGLARDGFPIEKGKKYCFTFDASSSIPGAVLQLNFREVASSSGDGVDFYIDENKKTYSYVFTALSTTSSTRFTFYMGDYSSVINFNIGNIKFIEFKR